MMADRRITSAALPVCFFVVLLVMWQYVPQWFGVPSYVFPRPSEVVASIAEVRTVAWHHLWVTALEASAGFAIGAFVGCAVGILVAESGIMRRTILPYVIASNAIPVVAVAPIVMLWFGHGLWSKTVVAAFLCFFPVTISTYRGLTEYNEIYSDLFRAFGGRRWQFFLKFKLWNGLPFLFSGMRVSATYSVIGAVVAEFVGSDSGLGFGMLQATYNLNTPRLYGYLVIACALGVLMYGIVVAVERGFVLAGWIAQSSRVKW